MKAGTRDGKIEGNTNLGRMRDDLERYRVIINYDYALVGGMLLIAVVAEVFAQWKERKGALTK